MWTCSSLPSFLACVEEYKYFLNSTLLPNLLIVGVWAMVVTLWQQFDCYYYYDCIQLSLGSGIPRLCEFAKCLFIPCYINFNFLMCSCSMYVHIIGLLTTLHVKQNIFRIPRFHSKSQRKWSLKYRKKLI